MKEKLGAFLIAGLFIITLLPIISSDASATDAIATWMNPSADAYTYEYVPNTNLGTATTVSIGDSNSNYHNYAFVKFDLSALSGKTIKNAILTMTSAGGSYATNAILDLYRVTSTWTEAGITYNTMPTHSATKDATFTLNDCSISGQVCTWNITTLVGNWTAGTTNYGFELIDHNGWTGHVAVLDSREAVATYVRPSLAINGGISPSGPGANIAASDWEIHSTKGNTGNVSVISSALVFKNITSYNGSFYALHQFAYEMTGAFNITMTIGISSMQASSEFDIGLIPTNTVNEVQKSYSYPAMWESSYGPHYFGTKEDSFSLCKAHDYNYLNWVPLTNESGTKQDSSYWSWFGGVTGNHTYEIRRYNVSGTWYLGVRVIDYSLAMNMTVAIGALPTNLMAIVIGNVINYKTPVLGYYENFTLYNYDDHQNFSGPTDYRVKLYVNGHWLGWGNFLGFEASWQAMGLTEYQISAHHDILTYMQMNSPYQDVENSSYWVVRVGSNVQFSVGALWTDDNSTVNPNLYGVGWCPDLDIRSVCQGFNPIFNVYTYGFAGWGYVTCSDGPAIYPEYGLYSQVSASKFLNYTYSSGGIKEMFVGLMSPNVWDLKSTFPSVWPNHVGWDPEPSGELYWNFCHDMIVLDANFTMVGNVAHPTATYNQATYDGSQNSSIYYTWYINGVAQPTHARYPALNLPAGTCNVTLRISTQGMGSTTYDEYTQTVYYNGGSDNGVLPNVPASIIMLIIMICIAVGFVLFYYAAKGGWR